MCVRRGVAWPCIAMSDIAQDGWTALHLATRHTSVARLLVARCPQIVEAVNNVRPSLEMHHPHAAAAAATLAEWRHCTRQSTPLSFH